MRNGLIVDKDGTKLWCVNDLPHRTDGPAIEWANGSKEWYVDGQRHRTGGPAVEYAYGSKGWYAHGKRHRTDGPAVEWVDGRKEWWFKGACLGYDQKGFWALWAKLTPEEQNNLTLLQYMAEYMAGVK